MILTSKSLQIITLVIVLCAFHSSNFYAQELVFRKGSKHLVYKSDTIQTMDNLFNLMRPHKEAFTYIESARDNKFWSVVFGGVGGAVVGYPIGQFLVTGKFNWPVFAAGVGIIGISVPLHMKYVKQTERAVIAYNNRNNTGFNFTIQSKIQVTPNRIGLNIIVGL